MVEVNERLSQATWRADGGTRWHATTRQDTNCGNRFSKNLPRMDVSAATLTVAHNIFHDTALYDHNQIELFISVM